MEKGKCPFWKAQEIKLMPDFFILAKSFLANYTGVYFRPCFHFRLVHAFLFAVKRLLLKNEQGKRKQYFTHLSLSLNLSFPIFLSYSYLSFSLLLFHFVLYSYLCLIEFSFPFIQQFSWFQCKVHFSAEGKTKDEGPPAFHWVSLYSRFTFDLEFSN